MILYKSYIISEKNDSLIENMGKALLFSKVNEKYDCPTWVVALLKNLSEELERVMWNITQKEYDSPFYNTGNSFKCNTFEVYSYDWGKNSGKDYNFKYKDIEISWYKNLGRDTLINKIYSPNTIISMYNNCLKAIREIEINKENIDIFS